MKIIHVMGARPNFMKVAPVYRAIQAKGFAEQLLVHTGQHYDAGMSDVFLQQLEIPVPDFNLSVGSGTHAAQTAEIMIRFEQVLMESRPDLVLVYGDVNSTLAAAIVCSKLHIKIGHVEAGLRAFDRTMPEEINRVLTDQVADLLFTPSQDGNDNLQREGVAPEKIFLVGNVMIDTLIHLLPKALALPSGKHSDPYVLLTLHRPSNVDNLTVLREMLETTLDVSGGMNVVFPVHPRTRKRLNDIGVNTEFSSHLELLEPVPYIEFLALQHAAQVVLTDSGGVQEETTFLGVPCLTLRENTERPVTVSCGTNTLVGTDMQKLRSEFSKIKSGSARKGSIPPLWDGKTGERIADILKSLSSNTTCV
jgi:UDP-N-acetylglucosamine 2-epimerase (non-hydrolysing)